MEELNESRSGLVQRLKMTEKERDKLEDAKVEAELYLQKVRLRAGPGVRALPGGALGVVLLGLPCAHGERLKVTPARPNAAQAENLLVPSSDPQGPRTMRVPVGTQQSGDAPFLA